MQKYTGNTRTEELAKLTACQRKLMYLSIIPLALAIAALVTALLKAMIPSVVCLLLLFLLRVTLHRKARKDYQQAMVDATLACSVGAKLDQFELSSKGGIGITQEEIRAAELIPIREGGPSTVGLYQGIAGTLRGMNVSLNDVSLQQYKSAGHEGVTVTVGVWMHFVLPRDSGWNLRILSRDILPDDLRREFYASLPHLAMRSARDAGFRESLYLYDEVTPVPAGEEPIAEALDDPGEGDGATAVTTVRPLPSSLTSAVDNLFRKATSIPAISIRGNTVDFFFRNRVLAPNYRQNTKPDESFLNIDPVPEFRDALNLVKIL